MPAWEVHRKWARRLGIPDKISRDIDKMIDFPEKWLEDNKKYSNHPLFTLSEKVGESGHDIGRSFKWQRDLLLEMAYEIHGSQGVKAVILHHALDYIREISYMPKEELLTRLENKIIPDKKYKDFGWDVWEIIDENFEEILNDVGDIPTKKLENRLKFSQAAMSARGGTMEDVVNAVREQTTKNTNKYYPQSKKNFRVRFVVSNWEGIINVGLRECYERKKYSHLTSQEERRYIRDVWDYLTEKALWKINNGKELSWEEKLITLNEYARILLSYIFISGVESDVFKEEFKDIISKMAPEANYERLLSSFIKFIKQYKP